MNATHNFNVTGLQELDLPVKALDDKTSLKIVVLGIFILSGGVVENVNYTRLTGGLITEGEQCAFVLQD